MGLQPDRFVELEFKDGFRGNANLFALREYLDGSPGGRSGEYRAEEA